MGRQFYCDTVLPQLDLTLSNRYPLLGLEDHPGYHSLGDHPIVMLAALTGTGKTATLRVLRQMLGGAGMDVIPSRREVADCIAIPTVQAMRGEALLPVSDRARRFQHTKAFAERVPGGMAAAFSWLRLANCCQSLLIAEGIRGAEEIGYALRRFPRWTIIEFSLHPLTRLRRLSARRESFDQAGSRASLRFLPHELREEARSLLADGVISNLAVNIMAAEAANYGLYPFADGAGFANYRRLHIDGLAPAEVADLTRGIIAEAKHAKH